MNKKVKILLKGGLNFTGRIDGEDSIGVNFLEETEVFNCKTKKQAIQNRELFIPWTSILYYEFLKK